MLHSLNKLLYFIVFTSILLKKNSGLYSDQYDLHMYVLNYYAMLYYDYG